MNNKLLACCAALLALLLALSGCAKGDTLDVQTAQTLLSNDYELSYIFDTVGLPVSSKNPKKAESGALYFLVESEKYKTVADLDKLLQATYTTEVAARLLATADANGAPLFADIDGLLCRSASPLFPGSIGTVDAKSVKLEQSGDDKTTATVAFTVQLDESNTVAAKMQLVQTKAGWRLTESRGAQALGQTEEDAAEPTATPRQTLDAFLAALAAGDGQQLLYRSMPEAGMGWSEPENYNMDFVAECGITAATVTETLSEEADSADYRVSLTVSGGNKVFAEGTKSYRVQVLSSGPMPQEGVSPYYVSALWPEDDVPYERLPYEERTNRAIEQVSRLIALHGVVQFATPTDLSADLRSEYLLYELTVAQPDQSQTGYTLEEVQRMALRLLGDESFVPTDNFKNGETGLYVMWGRGLAVTNNRLVQTFEGNGLVTVESINYNDPLKLRETSRVIYSLKNNWNGTYELVSGTLAQG